MTREVNSDCRCEAEFLSLLRPAPTGLLEAYEVGSAVGAVANEGPGLIEPV